ncbi:uncharacterized protein BP5553_09218 [Venustampulla echinocandica]|uniref:Xylanolytic transcriptional activator regulatory domain-containing protein n=1 Tax=Venustampulla echinocandica TaxID=2656787 RepID=A0A370TC62_9HELO|nr:uncharacterized protein BP5553_09218 [Venustampulla echinocandica]RDL31816.1 hypothetical protein BP5553_09218 [Venustampulla echinocandica]
MDLDQDQSSQCSRPSEMQQNTPEQSTSSFSPPEIREAENRNLGVGNPATPNMNENSDCYHVRGPSGPAISNAAFISPTDQDIIDFLTESIPEVWHTEGDVGLDACQSYSIVPDGYGTNISPVMPEFETSYPVRCENGSNQVLLAPEETAQQMMLQSGGIDRQRKCYSLEVPKAIVDHLIDLYFQRVQVFLPLFHRPRFYKTFVEVHAGQRYTNLTRESAFLLLSMMALSARYSKSPYFESTHVKDRGTLFARRAQAIYDEAPAFSEFQTPSLKLLQGCILLSYYNQSCKPSWGSDFSINRCTSLAYDLDLHKIDEDSLDGSGKLLESQSPEIWILKEEQRRAWWSVWELDAFDSVAFRRPFKIDRNRMFVFLPVSDEAWFAGIPIISAMLNTDIMYSWKSLKDTPNQDERAWFLISNFVMVHAHDLAQQRVIHQTSVEDIQMAVTCFSLLINEKLRVDLGSLTFNENNYAKSNWTILTQLMVQTTRLILGVLSRHASSQPVFTGHNRFVNRSGRATPSGLHLGTASLENLQQPLYEIFRICRAWSPDFISLSPPTMVCMVVGPANTNLRLARLLRRGTEKSGVKSQPSIQEELLTLVLTHFARHWNMGHIILGNSPVFDQIY